MLQKITEFLSSLEARENIKILYACESGSRGWGFASADSDYDVRFIYIRPIEWYLSVDDKEDSLQFPISGLLDIYGWDIRKVLKLIRKSNASPIEWLQSPIIYQEISNFREELLELVKLYFSPLATIHHYMGLAGNFFKDINVQNVNTKLKKYFYVTRPLLAALWVARYQTIPPMEYRPLLSLVDDKEALNILDDLLIKKLASTESDIIEVNSYLNEYISSTMNTIELATKEMKKSTADSEMLNIYFRKLLNDFNPGYRLAEGE